ncbi:MAG: adenylate/guanylate cyclase domain-containing protein [Spirulinaceae cyanobacterium]
MSHLAILCVDDQKVILDSLKEQLKRNLREVDELETAESAEEALEILEELKEEGIEVALIISDQIMPGMKGDEFLIKAEQLYPQIIKIMLTGQADAKAVGNVVNKANLYRYLDKPWEETDLILTVKEALRSYRQNQQLLEQNAELQRLNSQLQQLNSSLEEKIAERTQELRRANVKLEQRIAERQMAETALRLARQRSDNLILNILPAKIAEKLKQGQSIVAEQFDEATILFADLVDFTRMAAFVKPIELVDLLNNIFSEFDELADKHGLEKIKTIGDEYMVVGGVPVPQENAVEAIAEMALAMGKVVSNYPGLDNSPLQIRIGINTGKVVAGVIGLRRFSYDLWGDAVNIASRMESSGIPGKIQVTTSTYQKLKDKYLLEPRGKIAIKGKGNMMTYWLVRKK